VIVNQSCILLDTAFIGLAWKSTVLCSGMTGVAVAMFVVCGSVVKYQREVTEDWVLYDVTSTGG